jgi:hypothetical protein
MTLLFNPRHRAGSNLVAEMEDATWIGDKRYWGFLR